MYNLLALYTAVDTTLKIFHSPAGKRAIRDHDEHNYLHTHALHTWSSVRENETRSATLAHT